MRQSAPTSLVLLALAAAGIVLLTGCSAKLIYCWTTYDPDVCGGRDKSAAASPGDALYVSASAHSVGALGTNWRSDVEVHNLADEWATYRIWLLEHGADNSSPDHRELGLAAGESVNLGDVLASEFGTEGLAALVLVPSSGRIIVTSRTFNQLGEGNELGLPAGSTFGQYIPAHPLGTAIRAGEQGRLIQLSHSDSDDGGFRTNIGLVNATDDDLVVDVALYAATGALLGTVQVVLPPQGYRQLNRVFASVTADPVEDGYAVVSTSTAEGQFFAYASVVDNLTGDPVAIIAERLRAEAPSIPSRPAYVVASAHVAGAAGTNWRTDVEVHCWSDGGATYTVELLEHGADNSNPESRELTVDAGESVRFVDILDGVFGFEGAAALRITPSVGQILVTSRTYNLLGEGNELGLPAGATFGQYIPGVDASDAIGAGEEGRLIQLSHTPDGSSGFRTNLVLVSASPGAVDVEIDLYRADGTLLGTVTRTLQPFEYRQLNRVFETVTGEAVVDGYAVLRTTTEGGAFFALASVVDNLTGDPVGMSAPTILSPGSEEILEEVVDVYDFLGQGSIEDALGHVQSLGVGGVLDGIVSVQPEVATRTVQGLVIDYGDGYAAPGGSFRTGTIDVDTSGVSVTAEGLSGVMTITHDQLTIDGETSAVGSTMWIFDLAERADGTVTGGIDVNPLGGVKSNGSLSGTIGIDTAICLEYPISGYLTAVVEDETITITFQPDCDGSVDHEVEPVQGGGGGGGDLLAVEWSFESSTSLVGTIDSGTGEWSAVGSSGFPRVNALARSGGGVFYSNTETGTFGSKSLITIDAGTGTGSLVAEITGLAEEHYVSGLAFSPSGTLYATVGEVTTVEPVDDLYTIDPHTGVARHVGPIVGFEGVNSIDFDDASGVLYGWNYPTGLMTINPATAAGTDVNPAVGGPSVAALVVLPDGTIVGGQHDLYAIDRNTGETTLIAEGVLSNVRGIEVLEDR